MKLTKATVSRLYLPDGKGEALFFDDALPGFGVRIRAGGKRSWVVQYRIKNSRQQRRETLGTVESMDVDEARRQARSTLAKVHLGTDPKAERVAARAAAQAEAAVTLGSVVEDYLTRQEERRLLRPLKASSLSEVKRHLRSHWAPLSGVPLRKVTRANVAARLARIADDSGGYTANRARAALSSLYGFAIAEGLADENPVLGTRRATVEVARDRVLFDAELTAAWRLGGEGDYGVILRLLALTGQRRDEVGGMAWAEVDLAAATWRIPGERTKNGRAHVVPLSAPALALLKARERREGSDLVFGSRGGRGGFSGWSKSKAALDVRMAAAGIAGESWRLHDLRRTAATRMADLGVLPHVVEAVLNHVSGHKAGVAGVYNLSSYVAEKRAALDMWAARVTALTGGEG